MISISQQIHGCLPRITCSQRSSSTMQSEALLSDDESVGPAVSGSPRATALTPEQRPNAASLDGEDLTHLALQANGRRRDPTGDQALMGAVHEDGNVHGLEAMDENGELVADEFTKFLQR